MKVTGSIVITDPCYMHNYFGSCLMRRSTIYGDWSCMVYPGKLGETNLPDQWDEKYFKFFKEYNSEQDLDKKESMRNEFQAFREEWKKNILGEFCADSGQVAVFEYDKLNDVSKEWIKSHPWCATVIEDFDGDVDFVVNDKSVHVVGIGNKNFFSIQSGF